VPEGHFDPLRCRRSHGLLDAPRTRIRTTRFDPVRVGELCLYFLKLGSFGFGGPIALVGSCSVIWSKGDAGSLSRTTARACARQLVPGALAAQLAIYLGWVRAASWGDLVAFAFILPRSDGPGPVGLLPPLRRPLVEHGAFLRIGAASRHHRPVARSNSSGDARPGLAPVVALRRECVGHCLDGVGDRLVFLVSGVVALW